MTDDPLDLPEGIPPWVRRVVQLVATRRGHKVLWWTIGALLALAFLAFLAVGANRPADPELVQPAPTTTTTTRVPPTGFGEAALGVTPAGGAPSASATPWCVLVADNPTSRAQGLMGRTDLAGYDAMAFVFPQDTTAPFHMRNTPIPLSIAFFDRTGAFVSTTEMAPCEDRDGCPTYRATRRYRSAIEVPAGGLGRLGIGPASRTAVGGACA